MHNNGLLQANIGISSVGYESNASLRLQKIASGLQHADNLIASRSFSEEMTNRFVNDNHEVETLVDKDDDTLAAKARQAAEEFVAISLVQPILNNLRSEPLVDPENMAIHPGEGEKVMQPLWDAQVAKRIVKAADWPIVDRLADQLLKKSRDIYESQNVQKVNIHA